MSSLRGSSLQNATEAKFYSQNLEPLKEKDKSIDLPVHCILARAGHVSDIKQGNLANKVSEQIQYRTLSGL